MPDGLASASDMSFNEIAGVIATPAEFVHDVRHHKHDQLFWLAAFLIVPKLAANDRNIANTRAVAVATRSGVDCRLHQVRHHRRDLHADGLAIGRYFRGDLQINASVIRSDTDHSRLMVR